MGVMVNAMVQTLDSMGDVLERDCGLAPEAVMKVQEVCDRVRQELYEQCSK
jgi:hypothetical protein